MESLREFKDFLKKRKLFWMAPLLIVLALFGLLLIFAETS